MPWPTPVTLGWDGTGPVVGTKCATAWAQGPEDRLVSRAFLSPYWGSLSLALGALTRGVQQRPVDLSPHVPTAGPRMKMRRGMENEDVRKVACTSPLPSRDLPESPTWLQWRWVFGSCGEFPGRGSRAIYLGHLPKILGLECTSGKNKGNSLLSRSVGEGETVAPSLVPRPLPPSTPSLASGWR